MEKKRDEAKEEAQVARLVAVAARNTKAKMEGDLARAKDALGATEEARVVAKEFRSKAESEVARLEVDLASLLIDLGMAKDEVYSLQPQSDKDKEAMKEEYQEALEVIFAYGYGCCVFKHNICRDCPEVPDGMPNPADPLPPEFFVNPGCPPV